MKSHVRFAAALALALTLAYPVAALAQKKAGKKNAAAGAPPAASVARVADDTSGYGLSVEPYAIFGSGRPGKAAADFDKPDGVAFTPNGYLLATDAKNRRVQVWDVRTRARLGEFGHKFFGGEIVDIAVAPSGTVYVTDQTLNLAYVFAPPAPGATDKDTGKALEPYEYQFKGTRFGEQGFDKLGGVLVDTRGRVYAVDAHLNEVRRFTPEGAVDASWHFEKGRDEATTYLHGCEGIALDERTGDLFVASEKDAVIQVFDAETGTYRRKMIGAAGGETGVPLGERVFAGSVEGLALAGGRLFAVDESVGHIQVFDISNPKAFNTGLVALVAGPRGHRPYLGYIGHTAKVDFEDKTNLELQQQVKDGAVIPGQANPPGYFCSPDSVSTWTDATTSEIYVAVADQCNYRIAVYRWSDIARSFAPGAATSGKAGKAGKAGKVGKKGMH